MLSFPTISPVTSGQTLGAAQLNSYKSALEYLLGESHAPMSLPGRASSVARYQTSWGTVWTGYLYHGSNTLYYLMRMHNQGSGKVCHARLLYTGDDGAQHVVKTISAVNNDWTVHSGTVDLSSETQLTPGRAYEWRWQTRTDEETYNTVLEVWTVAERGAISGWLAPPTFAAGMSDPDDLNTLRTDLNLLYANMVARTAALCRPTAQGWENDLENWHSRALAVWRYRPQRLYARVRLRASARVWCQWRVSLSDQADRSAALYTSDEIEVFDRRWASVTIGMTDAAVAAALSAAGITLTAGQYYTVKVGIRKTQPAPDAYSLDHVFLCRLSSQAPAAGWAVPHLFAHGDTAISPANMAAYSTDLLELYSGGERLWGESPAMWAGGHQDQAYGYHRKRWLCYLHAEDARPQLYHGANLADSMDLPTGTGWQVYDLGQVAGLPWGGLMYLTGCTAAFECDAPVV